MGGLLSSFFQSGSALLGAAGAKQASRETQETVARLFGVLQENPRAPLSSLQPILSAIPRSESVAHVYNESGYSLPQVCAAINHAELLRWCVVNRGMDPNRGACSLPLHIACLKGHVESVEVLLRCGARVELEARMCWPGAHSGTCEHCSTHGAVQESGPSDRSSSRLQSAIYYAIDGDQVEVVNALIQQAEHVWFPWQQRRPLLHLACQRGAWECVRFLVAERPDEINTCHDEYYPVHQAVVHDARFVSLLVQFGADPCVRTATQQMTALHVLFLLGQRSAKQTLMTLKLLINTPLRALINTPDSLGNTPLHALIVRYALEECRYGYDQDPPPWNKWDMLHLMRHLLHHGAAPSINQQGNSALACVLRHVRDWEFRYELLQMLLQSGADPNLVGRDGSLPLMVCLVPLINKDPLHHFTHAMKVFYLSCVRLLCRHGANPNCWSRSNLTPLHVLMFTASENIALSREEEKSQAFSFIRQLLVVLLQHGLDPNVRFSKRTQHILLSLMDMVQNARHAGDLGHVADLTTTLLQYGADPNVNIATTEPMICHSQSSVFLKKSANQVMYYYVQLLVRREELVEEGEGRYRRLLHLYHMTMDTPALSHCLRILHTQAALVPMVPALAALIRQLYREPRRLKQLCRVAVMRAVGGKVALACPSLPLPPPLRDYILSFDP